MTEQTPESSYLEVTLGFMGNFSLKLDNAQRVAIPAKFKEVLDKTYGASANQVVLVPDEGKVKVLPVPVWKKMEEEIKKLPPFDPAADSYRTFVYGNLAVCQLDVQNRVRLTPSLCRLAELQKEVVVVGQQDQMEIWDAAKWNEFNASTAKSFKSVMQDVFRNRHMVAR